MARYPHTPPSYDRFTRTGLDRGVVSIPAGNGQILLTRRHLLFGAAAIGAAIGVTKVAKAVSSAVSGEEEISILEVSSSDLLTSNDLQETEQAAYIKLVGDFKIDYGTLVFANDPDYAACLIPTETASPLTKVGVLDLNTGELKEALDAAQGASEGFEIYDVRVNSSGMVWTEANVLADRWRIYTARWNGSGVSDIKMVDEGTKGWQTPSIAVASSYAFWQVLPTATGEYSSENSLLRKAPFGTADHQDVYSSPGRMSSPVYALENSVVITPRTNTSTVHHQLTLIDAATDEVLDKMVLPASMKPLEAGYGKNGFMFSFDVIYSYGDGISNLGTYTPLESVSNGQYSDIPWFSFVRTPTAAPAWCGDCFCVKSTSAVVGVDLAEKRYFAIEVPTGVAEFGEYLASTGMSSTIVTYCNIDYTPMEIKVEKTTDNETGVTTVTETAQEPVYCCNVRVWRAI